MSMDATDFAIGIVLIALLTWVSLISLNQGAAGVSIADLYAISSLSEPLISPEELCPAESGFKLVQPERIDDNPYYVSVGKTEFRQTYFCFYEKVDESA